MGTIIHEAAIVTGSTECSALVSVNKRHWLAREIAQ